MEYSSLKVKTSLSETARKSFWAALVSIISLALFSATITVAFDVKLFVLTKKSKYFVTFSSNKFLFNIIESQCDSPGILPKINVKLENADVISFPLALTVLTVPSPPPPLPPEAPLFGTITFALSSISSLFLSIPMLVITATFSVSAGL